MIVGNSVEGRSIHLHLFNADTTSKIDTLFIGVFHGDEGIAGDLLNKFIEHLQTSKGLIKTLEKPFGIIPVLNPDGLAKNQRMNANLVDLNRNYPTENWIEENKDTIYYSGKSPASEPETKLIIELLEQYKPQKIVTVHSPYKVINFDGDKQTGAESLANAMAKYSGYKVVADIGYPTPGSFGTYCGKERRIPTITLELPEDEPIEQVWPDNRDALLEAICFDANVHSG